MHDIPNATTAQRPKTRAAANFMVYIFCRETKLDHGEANWQEQRHSGIITTRRVSCQNSWKLTVQTAHKQGADDLLILFCDVIAERGVPSCITLPPGNAVKLMLLPPPHGIAFILSRHPRHYTAGSKKLTERDTKTRARVFVCFGACSWCLDWRSSCAFETLELTQGRELTRCPHRSRRRQPEQGAPARGPAWSR